jgi:cephalosporin hydroxylase
MAMWADWLGPSATIVGIDTHLVPVIPTPSNVHLYQGDGTDPELAERIITEWGPPHVVIDDGSHVGAEQWAGLRAWWPWLRQGGLHFIEDLEVVEVPSYAAEPLLPRLTLLARDLALHETPALSFLSFFRQLVVMGKPSGAAPGVAEVAGAL